ncbi:MAG: DUF4301 family protein [Muribaculaceae bacterium]|nr:DUF4301 family protein [Muribaculaceae bacterium]
MELDQKDLAQLERKGISPETLEKQLDMLAKGFPWLRIEGPATPGHGITVAGDELIRRSVEIWDEYRLKGGRVQKMTPASGAASRMFKDLYAFLNGKHDKPDTDFVKEFFAHIEDFAFFERLNFICLSLYDLSVDSLIREKRYKDVVDALLASHGLNYGKLPKALLQFHKELGGSRTALEEHLAEAAQYAAGKDGKARVHFTVSEEHVPLMMMKIEETRGRLEHLYGVTFDITLSVQKPSTDTVAANMDGTPYREKGDLFFRPGGHGALIENLNDLDADVIFIKNIDNVVPDSKRAVTLVWKQVIGGVLVAVKQKIDSYCRQLSKGTPDEATLAEMLDFTRRTLYITHDGADDMTLDEKAAYLMRKLNRPVRVCGMVKNEGEPGGGPFLVYNPDGTVSPQILESSQINPDDKEAMKYLKEATHFNPVDLVVATHDWKGDKFHLPDYVDAATGFISIKSREGVAIKALELPGLWNGAMSDWNTILVEVPAETFNPVKTVNDLLRPAHKA